MMKLRDLAHARTGDKGNIINISVIAFREQDYEFLNAFLTADRVSRLFAPILAREAERYCIPGLAALNFVLHRPAGESVTRSIGLDAHGKALASVLLNLEVEAPGADDPASSAVPGPENS